MYGANIFIVVLGKYVASLTDRNIPKQISGFRKPNANLEQTLRITDGITYGNAGLRDLLGQHFVTISFTDFYLGIC